MEKQTIILHESVLASWMKDIASFAWVIGVLTINYYLFNNNSVTAFFFIIFLLIMVASRISHMRKTMVFHDKQSALRKIADIYGE